MEYPASQESENLGTQEYWKRQFDCAKKDADYSKFLEQGKKIVKRYLSKTGDVVPRTTLNLFHSNTKTLESMLFGQTPKVNVDRRWSDPNDDAARVASNMLERMLNTDIGLRTDKYASALRRALHDYLTVGLGQSRVRYEAIFQKTEITAIDPATGQPILSLQETLEKETTHIDYVFWQDFRWDIGRSWEEVEWVAFRTWMTEQEIIARWGEDVAKSISYTDKKGDDEIKGAYRCGEIWEIWSKKDKNVYWYNEGARKLLETRPDPLKLWGFFPCPQPMMANLTTTKLVPKADYIFAQDLYNEIDLIEQRIEMLTKAVKVVGVYDQASTGIQRMLTDGVDNELIPVDNWAMFAEKGGLKGQLDWLPIEAVVNALEKLITLRDDAINMLYQVTGMSDILRGQSTESRVSATEQNLKAKFASVRVQALQDMFAYFATDLQMLKTNIIVLHYDPQTIIKQSNVMSTADADMAEQAVALIKNPQEEIWKIQVRPESVAMVDYAQIKQERSEFMMSVSQYMQSAAPILQQDPSALPFLLEMLKWSLAGFKGSSQIEGITDKMIQQVLQKQQEAAQQPPQPSPEEQAAQAKAQAEQQKAQVEAQKSQTQLQVTQMQAQSDQQKAQMEAQMAQQQFQAEMAKLQMEMQKQQQEFALEMRKMQMEFQLFVQKLAGQLQLEEAKAEAAEEKMEGPEEESETESES
jgi:hypothetical protein